MHLKDLLSFRAVPAAGISLGLTRRCPLSCAHCSTNSTSISEQAPAKMYIRFVDTFTPLSHPEVVAMSGGEAMLRPKLVRELAERARAVGTRSVVLSGMFFARAESVPPLIQDAIDAVDHFSVSIDAYHEREVPRANVFRIVASLLDKGTSVSMHIVGQNADDPYLERTVSDVKNHFGNKVPMLVNSIASFGRAKQWYTPSSRASDMQNEANPCGIAGWPVVGFNGTIVACANDDVLDDVPTHLRIGHASVDDWNTVRERILNSHMVRAIRLFGPEYIANRFSKENIGCGRFCQTCMKLSHDPRIEEEVREVMIRPTTAIMEKCASTLQRQVGAIAFAQQYGLPRYADLVTLGAML